MKLDAFLKLLKGKVDFNVLMKEYTTFHIGGKAKAIVFPENIEELKKILLFCGQQNIPLRILGNGSNILVKDNGFKGIFIFLKKCASEIEVEKNNLIIGAGVDIKHSINFAYRNGISGLEFLSGIPGTIGGAIKTNAGIGEKSIGELIKDVSVMDEKGNIFTLKKVAFKYRKMLLPENLIILKTKFNLEFQDKEKIRKKIKEFFVKKKLLQPLKEFSAGCIFKNPKQDTAAGSLIEKAKLKGFKVNDAMVSYKHANFIINKGKASAKDVLKLIEIIKERVKKEFNTNLELEIEII